MSTNSSIAMVMPDGKIKAIYCHWDGYVSHNGRLLKEHYTSVRKIKRLLSFGAMSSLREKVGRKHSFDNMDSTSCTFYHRDRGDDIKDCKASIFSSIGYWRRNHRVMGCSYFYLFRDGAWICWDWQGQIIPII